MNNEPVAWMYAVNGIWTAFSDELPPDDAYDEGTLTPLYTHPAKALETDCYGDGNVYRGVRSKDSEVKTYVFDEHAGKQVWSNPAKTLTDEEKIHFGMLFMNWNRSLKEPLVKPAYEQYVFEQALAILRKANEK